MAVVGEQGTYLWSQCKEQDHYCHLVPVGYEICVFLCQCIVPPVMCPPLSHNPINNCLFAMLQKASANTLGDIKHENSTRNTNTSCLLLSK